MSEWGKARGGSKKSKAGFGMGFCITGGVLGIRCNLEGSSFEPPGSLYIYDNGSRCYYHVLFSLYVVNTITCMCIMHTLILRRYCYE